MVGEVGDGIHPRGQAPRHLPCTTCRSLPDETRAYLKNERVRETSHEVTATRTAELEVAGEDDLLEIIHRAYVDTSFAREFRRNPEQALSPYTLSETAKELLLGDTTPKGRNIDSHVVSLIEDQ